MKKSVPDIHNFQLFSTITMVVFLVIIGLWAFFPLNQSLATTDISTDDAHADESNLHFLNPQDFNLYPTYKGTDSYSPSNGFSIDRPRQWNPDESLFVGKINCTATKCVSIDEAVKKAVLQGFPSRAQWESVYKARQQILAAIGRLLPRIEISFGAGGIGPSGIFGMISNLLGFLVPSNWFNWKESKLIYHAQKSSYQGLLQDQVSNTEVLYYNIHRVNFDLLIYDYYTTHLQKFVEEIKERNQLLPEEKKVPELDLLILENYLAELNTDGVALDRLIRAFDEYDMAIAMAYGRISEIGILPIVLPNLTKIAPYTVTPKDVTKIKSRSMTLLTLRYLQQAARYARLSRIFSFLGSGGTGADSSIGISFGLDYVANLRIANSDIRELKIRHQETTLQIENLFLKAVDGHNASIYLYNQYVDAKEPNRALFRNILDNYNRNGTLAVAPLIGAINWALKFELGRNFVQHYYLVSKSQMQRLLVEGERYRQLQLGAPGVPAAEHISLIRDRLRWRENREIDKAIRRGELNINNP
ncbi:MAG: hypothetical protein HQK53_15775 [Oligoflexia bacterium]|nr:hypothetical protein [Oligoflexia bacterium]